ncbi:endonuclease III domain-containing protein [Desulfovibrio aminophilus]|nr:endonuclease III domain-containing protein [Desulfovibrio aminophilus]MCM0754328.1 endonuclease III domain-containing protein [Desulfovibrio aminophilus]
MLAALGPSNWWPGETPFEVAVGAILTQNTNWVNVEKAIANLKNEGALEPKALSRLSQERLEECLRPAGYFRLKAVRLRNFLDFLKREAGLSMEALAQREHAGLRERLLTVKGIGPETADSILLYALNAPVFVVDAYTQRIFSRHGLIPEESCYHDIQALFMDALPRDVALYNEYHALIVRTAKQWCVKKTPRCEGGCPLASFLEAR